MALKISLFDYTKLAQLINAAKEQSDKVVVPQGSEFTNEKDLVWHLWHVAVNNAHKKAQAGDLTDWQFIFGLFQYLNDDNIEAALKKILKN